jgi:hypothetical protein
MKSIKWMIQLIKNIFKGKPTSFKHGVISAQSGVSIQKGVERKGLVDESYLLILNQLQKMHQEHMEQLELILKTLSTKSNPIYLNTSSPLPIGTKLPSIDESVLVIKEDISTMEKSTTLSSSEIKEDSTIESGIEQLKRLKGRI